MLKSLYTIGVAASLMLFSSCKEYKTNENGLKYKILADSAGPVAEEGGEALIHFEIRNHRDSVIESTFKRNAPVPLPINKPEFKGSLVEGILLLSKGDSAAFLISADSIFKTEQALPPGVYRGKDLKFIVKVVKLLKKEDVAKERVKMEKEYADRRSQMEGQMTNDTVIIVNHLKSKNIKFKKSPQGVYYSVTAVGGGKKLAQGDTVKVNYVGKFLDGKEFDSGKNFEVVLGVSQVIYGWHMGLAELSYGDKATLYIPSPLGYGPAGAGSIPPNTVLVFDLELPKK